MRWRSALGRGNDRNALAFAARAELDDPIGQCKKRMVPADSDVRSGIEARAALAYDNVPRDHPLAAEALNAEALSVRVAPVAGRTGALLGRKELEIELKHSRDIVAEADENATEPVRFAANACLRARRNDLSR